MFLGSVTCLNTDRQRRYKNNVLTLERGFILVVSTKYFQRMRVYRIKTVNRQKCVFITQGSPRLQFRHSETDEFLI